MNDQRVLYFDVYTRRTSIRPAATRVDTRLLGLSVVLLLLITSAGLLYLCQASTVAELRYGLAENESKRAELQEEIALVRCQIAANQSFAVLERRVGQLELVDAPRDDPIVVMSVVEPQAGEPGAGAGWLASKAPGLRRTFGRLLSLLAPRSQREAGQPSAP